MFTAIVEKHTFLLNTYAAMMGLAEKTTQLRNITDSLQLSSAMLMEKVYAGEKQKCSFLH